MYCESQLQKPARCSSPCNQGLNKTKVSFDKGKGFALVPCKSYFESLSQGCMGAGKKLQSVEGHNVSFWEQFQSVQ